MASKTRLSVVIVCFVLVSLAAGNIFNDMKLPTTRSPYTEGESAVYRIPGVCWCGPNTICGQPPVNSTNPCYCKPGYEGIPPKCRPAPELWHLCFENNSCGLHAECEVLNGTRRCPNCVPSAMGSPPSCIPTKGCNEVEKTCGLNADCDARFARFGPCSCAFGFVGEPPNCTAGPALLALCDPYPCGAHSNCRVQDGRAVCECARGYVGTPPRCEPSPEMWRVCFKDKPCGSYTKCDMIDRVAVCSSCDLGYSGEPPHCYKKKIAEKG